MTAVRPAASPRHDLVTGTKKPAAAPANPQAASAKAPTTSGHHPSLPPNSDERKPDGKSYVDRFQ